MGGPPPRRVSPKQAERLRRRAEQRRALVIRAAGIAAAALALWAMWFGISRSQLLQIDEIEVTGNEQLTAEQVIEMADLPANATLLRLDDEAVEERLLASPWIAEASLRDRPPSKLRIDIVERVPVALVDTGMTFWFVDGDARVIAESVPDTGTVLPVIRDLPDFEAEPGSVSESKALRNALLVLRGLSPQLVSMVRVVTAPTVNETTLLTGTSIEIMIGEAVQLEEKSIVVSDILEERGYQVVFIDVRSVERPISRGLEP